MHYDLRTKNIKIGSDQTSEIANLRHRMDCILGAAVAAEHVAKYMQLDAKLLLMTIEQIADLADPKNDYQPEKKDSE